MAAASDANSAERFFAPSAMGRLWPSFKAFAAVINTSEVGGRMTGSSNISPFARSGVAAAAAMLMAAPMECPARKTGSESVNKGD